MVDEKLKKQVIQDVTLLKLVGFKPIIVHGGGRGDQQMGCQSRWNREFIKMDLRKTDTLIPSGKLRD